MEKSKRFCNQCKWFRSGEFAEYCEHSSNIENVYTYKRKCIKNINEPDVLNRNNDCPKFEFKWYLKLWRAIRGVK